MNDLSDYVLIGNHFLLKQIRSTAKRKYKLTLLIKLFQNNAVK